MTIELTIENQNQSYNVVKGLLDRREWEVRHGSERCVEGIDDLLAQFEGTSVHNIIADSESEAFQKTADELIEEIDRHGDARDYAEAVEENL